MTVSQNRSSKLVITQAFRQSRCGTLTVEGGDVHAPSLGETRLAPIRPCRCIWLGRCQAVIFLEVPHPQCVVPASEGPGEHLPQARKMTTY